MSCANPTAGYNGDAHGGTFQPVVLTRQATHPPRSLRQRQITLLVLCLGILIATVDGSAVYVALPSIQADLGFSQSNLAWVVNAFLIPFGGILLFAGRLGDIVGQKRVFLSGLGLFTAASLGCGLAQSQAQLIALRFAQGVGAALATAVVLSMIVTMFPKPREQARALALYGFIAASAAVVGLLVGAVMTEALGWHWIFFINVPIGVATIAAATRLVDEVRDPKASRLDLLGAGLLVGALTLSVYTIVQAGSHGWGSWTTAGLGALSLALLVGFAVRQSMARHPLVPLGLLRSRNVAPSNLVLGCMVAGPTGMFFLVGLYLQTVLGYSPLELGLAFVPVAVAVAIGSLKGAPRLLRENDAKVVLLPSLVLIAAGLGLLARIPTHATYWLDILPAILLLGIGSGIATPAVFGMALAEATESDSGLRSGLVNMTQQIGAALGLAVMAPVAASVTRSALLDGHDVAGALTSGYRTAFLVGMGIVGVGVLLGVTILQRETPRTAPSSLDSTTAVSAGRRSEPTGATDADFVALGLGGTSMMSMLWAIAMGRRAVGIELRGGPYFAVMQWQMSEDLYHHLALIDRMMLERYGEERLPRRGDGSVFSLHECFWSLNEEGAGDARADEVITGWYPEDYIAAPVESTELVDDRWVDGAPRREITTLPGTEPSAEFDPSRVGRQMADVVGERQSFLVAAEELLLVLRRYLEAVEKMDLAAGLEPRCRIFLYHRVARASDGVSVSRWLRRRTHLHGQEEGFVRGRDGRVRIRVEAIRELDDKRTYRRIREPGSKLLDLGTPELFMVAQNVDSEDAARLGLKHDVVRVDHGDGRGPVPAQADYVIGVTGALLDNVTRHRVASVFDKEGNEYWVRQTAIGHEGQADTAWFVCEVPDFKTFDPVLAGMVPKGTPRVSKKFYGAYHYLVRDFFLDQVSVLTELPKEYLRGLLVFFGMRMISVTSKVGRDALVAANGVVAGDSFGNGSFLSSFGAVAGLVGHASRTLEYWQARDAGVTPEAAVRTLADRIKEDTETWVRATEHDFAQPARPSAVASALEKTLDAIRRRRRRISPVVYRDDWSRLNTYPGRLHTDRLPPLGDTHPDEPGWLTPRTEIGDEDIRSLLA
jgi:EmrB/QacA subfamily drug resistance transporter